MLDRRSDRTPQQVVHPPEHQPGQIDGLDLQILLSGKSQQPLRQRRPALARPNCPVDQTRRPGIVLDNVLTKQLQISEERPSADC